MLKWQVQVVLLLQTTKSMECNMGKVRKEGRKRKEEEGRGRKEEREGETKKSNHTTTTDDATAVSNNVAQHH